ncbi:MAG: TolC family protein, partial [Planctomycetes bacterium]|nr:TolC family protein [Planctomycetota bacterium]
EGLLEDTDWDFLLGVEFSIFEGGLTQARMSETYSLLRKSQYAYDLLKKNIGAEISQLWHRYNSSSAVIKSLEESVSLSKERYSLLELQYKNQLASELDLRNADLEYQAAAEQLSSEQINRKQIIIQLLVSIGKIK